MILPDWFYTGLLDTSLVLTLDPVYFQLTGGLQRWLYRMVRKHAGQQRHVGISILTTCGRSPGAPCVPRPSRFTCVTLSQIRRSVATISA